MRVSWVSMLFFFSPSPPGRSVQGYKPFAIRLPAAGQAGETEVLGGR